MRNLYLVILIFLTSVLTAQAPQGINYQGVARSSSGAAMGMTNIAIQIKLFQGNPNGGGALVYSEIHSSVPTDTFGLYNLTIGSTSGSGTGTFSAVPWSAGNIWVEVSIDPGNGTSFQIISQQQLMSVPYALYAEFAANGAGGSLNGTPRNIPKINPAGNGLKKSLINESLDSASIGIGVLNPNPNSALEIANTSAPGTAGRGLLIPRMTYAERNAISLTAADHGLIVYQTQPSGLFPQGFWYYDANVPGWLLLAPAQAVWTLSGNALTTPGSNYIGTMDDRDFVFKTGNNLFSPTERMRILSNSNGGNVQFGIPGSEYVFPAAKGNAGDILQLDPTGTNKLLWKPLASGNNMWTKVGGMIFPTNVTDSVGIGTNVPKAMLDIFANSSTAFHVRSLDSTSVALIEAVNFANYKPALNIDATLSSGMAVNAMANNNYAFYGTSNDATAVSAQNSSNNAATIEGFNAGTHAVAFFHNSPINGNAPVLLVDQQDPSAFSAKFQGGQGITTNGFQMFTGINTTGFVLQSYDAFGSATWVPSSSVGLWGLNAGTISPVVAGNVGIGVANALNPLSVAASTTTAVIMSQNTGSGDGLYALASGTGNGISGVNTGSGTGVVGYSNGTGSAGMFQIGNANSLAPALDVSHQGLGSAAIFGISLAANSSAAVNVNTVGTGPAIVASTNGTGSVANFSISNSGNNSAAFNVSTNGKGPAGNFQATNLTSTFPAFIINNSSLSPALKVDGSGLNGAITALFNGGSVGIGTGTVAPSSGLDVKTSVGVSVKKYPTAGNYSVLVTDQYVTHICATSGTFTFTIPDATLCPGRILIFTADQNVTGGTMIIQACCGQSLNGAATQTFGLTTGTAKPSVGVISDGSNWQIIFKN